MSEREEREVNEEEAESVVTEPRRRPKRAVPLEEPQVLGGRLMWAIGILAAVSFIPYSPLGPLLEPKDPPPTDTAKWKTGESAKVRITLVTADFAALSCAADRDFEGRHCANKGENELWPRDPSAPLDDNKANVIQPYRTWLDNRLILVSGLWASPAVALRLHREPPGNLLPEKLARFVTECQVRFVGTLESPKLRWSAGAAWGADPNTREVPVAVAESCDVIPEPSEDCPEGLICKVLTKL